MKQKLKYLRRMMEERELDSVIITRQSNFAWLTGGRSFIGLASETACGYIVVTRKDVFLVANNIEGERLRTEENCKEMKLLVYPWQNTDERSNIIGRVAGERSKDDIDLSNEFVNLRTVHGEADINSYSRAAKQTAKILETVMMNMVPGQTELEVAGKLSAKYWEVGIDPTTLLIAFDDRILKWRHPLPTLNKLEKIGLASVCVRYQGKFISATRLACFGSLNEEIRAKHDAVTKIDACYINSTKPGLMLKDVFAKAVKAYADNGYEGEWKHHHQGGLTGYMGRERLGNTEAEHIIQLNEVYAWNPTIKGTKSEDTMLVSEKGSIILTHTGDWKYLQVEGLKRPDIINL